MIAIVNGVPSNKSPTSMEQTAPHAIWMEPNIADAVPAPLWNGRKAKVATFGKLNPWQPIIKNNRKMFSSMVSHSNLAKIDNKRPNANCVGKVTRSTCKLLYFLSTTRFNWLAEIIPDATMANKNPKVDSLTP